MKQNILDQTMSGNNLRNNQYSGNQHGNANQVYIIYFVI